MKKIFYISLFFLFNALFFPVFAQNEQFFGIGAELFKDPFNNKLIITEVMPSSPTEKAGILAGSEIISVDGEKVKKKCMCEVIDKIRGENGTDVKLVIRNGWKWKTYTLKRESVTVEIPETDPQFDMYLGQIVPVCYNCIKLFPKEISDKFSRKYKKTILPKLNYWFNRKDTFKLGYDACMSFSKENKEMCLINLLNRESEKTNTDKKIYKFLKEEF